MSRLATSFVLGYHGCERSIAERAVAGEMSILQSAKPWDWIGPGAYFWESDPERAAKWALQRVTDGDYKEACVIGAVIDLGNCLNLATQLDHHLMVRAYGSLVEFHKKADRPLPKNQNSKKSEDADRRLRFLDCAVITHLHEFLAAARGAPFDTVRGMFTEGSELYAGSAFRDQNHIQIAVRTNECIKGLFFPPGLDALLKQ